MSNSLNAAQLAAQNRKIKAPKRRIAPGANLNSEPLFAPGAPGSGGQGLFGGSVQAPANNSFNFAAPVNPFGNSSVSFPPAVPGQGTPAKPDGGFNMSFAGQPNQPQQGGGLFGNTSASFGGQPSNPFGQSSQPAAPAGGFSFGQNNSQKPASNLFGNQQNAPSQPASSNFNFGSTAPAASNPFNFGASQQQPQQSQQTPSFSFGSTAKTEANSFGQTQTAPAAAPASNLFGGFGAQKPEPAKNPFGFNNQSQAGSVAGSQFGSQPTTREASPAPFQFGAATPAAEAPKANPFQFGSAAATPTAEKPASSFSFGQTQQPAGTPTAAPANNLFGNNGGSQTPAKSLFGNTQQNTPTSNLFGAKPDQQQTTAPSLFGASSQASQPASSFNFGQNSQQPAAPANNMFGQAKPANPFANLNAPAPASGSSTPFGQPSRSASPEKTMSEAEQKPAQNLFGGSQTPKPAAPTNMFGAAKVPQTAPQQAAKPNMFGQTNQDTPSAAPKNLFGGLPQPPKAAPASTESPAKPSLFSTPTPKPAGPSLFAPPKGVESPKPASQSLFGNTRAPSKLSEVTNASPASSPARPSNAADQAIASTEVAEKKSRTWETSTKEIAKSSGLLSKPVTFDDDDQIVKTAVENYRLDKERYASKSQEEINAMFDLYVARSKNWDENEFLNPYSYRKIAMMCAQYMKSHMSEREQLEAYSLVQIRISQRRAKAAFENAVKDEDEEKQLKIKYFYEYKERDIFKWAERQVAKTRRRAMDLAYEEEYEDRRRSKRPARDLDAEEIKLLEQTAKRHKASPSNSPPKLLTNGDSGSTTPRAPPPQKSIFGGSTPAAATPNNMFASSTPAAAPPKNLFGSFTPAAAPPATTQAATTATPTPSLATPSTPTPSTADTPKSKRKAEEQFDKDDPYGERAAASAKKSKSGSATASLFKSIVGKSGTGDGANGTPERKIATPGKKVDTPKANPFAALPGAGSPAPTAKANPFGGLLTPAPKANPFGNLPSAAPKSPTKTEAKANPFGNLPKPKSPVKAAAPGGFVFKPTAPAGEAPKASPFQVKPAASTPAAPVTGGFKPTFNVAPSEANDAFAKAAAAAKKKARADEMEKAKDEDWDSEGSVDEDEWEKRYWKKKEREDKEFAEKIKNPSLKVPSFGSSFGGNKPVEEAKDVSRSGTQSPNSVLDSYVTGSGKVTGAAAKNPFAHLSAATSPASSGKNDADDEDDKDKSDEKSAETPKGDLFSRTSFDPKAATPSLFGSVSKAADQTFKHDSPLKFAPTSSGTKSTNIFGASAAAPSLGLFGSTPASGTSTPAAAPKTSGFSFGGTETPVAKTPSLFGQLNQPKTSETPIPPPKPFSFLTNGKSSGIVSSINTSRATTPGLTTEGEATADEAAGSGDADAETVHEQMKDLASGDEPGEETLWISKASAKELKNGKWEKGLVGMLKVLKNKENGRVRYLMRLENGTPVLNKAYIGVDPKVNVKSLTVMMPNEGEEGQKVSNWNITVKTAEKLRELADVIIKCKKD